MGHRLGSGRQIALAVVLVVLSAMFSGGVFAAPRAAELGSEMPLAEAAGGFVGRLAVTPERGPAGTPLSVTGEGFAPEQNFDLVWRTVKGRWKVTIAEYHGREFNRAAYRIAT